MKPILLPVIVAALSFAALPAGADDDDYHDDHYMARDAVSRGAALPMQRILAIAARHAPGEVVEVKLDEDDGALQYELKVLTPAGVVRELTFDARTGALLADDEDD